MLAEATGATGGVTPRMAAALVAALHHVLFLPTQDLALGGRDGPETAEFVAAKASRCAFNLPDTWPRGPGGAAGRLLP
ncbi:hypothetical protein SO3561_10104 [Streptomyces olivochromogenes]|uniref:Uncharacterized protein n=1 Tax=Streptomyces olivochromogenes TaxID=1963 RepID=A0A286PG52_STROL|nr:hypothetical protein SO3561_10104 [Streptomyces olivochromogenes]